MLSEKTITLSSGVTRKIHEHGYTIINNINTIDEFVAFAASLGDFVAQKDAEECKPYVLVSEKNQINKLGFSQMGLFPHTDRSVLKIPPDLVLLWCQQPADEGGESLFVDMRLALKNLRNKNYALYQEIMATTAIFSDENHSDFNFSNIFYTEGASTYVRFRNDNFIFVPPRYFKAYDELLDLINSNVTTFKLLQGEVVILNNKRVLHGRNEFTGHRVLYRLHVNTIDKMRGCS